MNKKEFYYKSNDDKTQIHAIKWEPDGKPKAVFQIIHGMTEFIDRYDDFAQYLAGHGFVVAGEDHLGHGASVISDEYHGFFGKDGNAHVIADIHQLRKMMHAEYPDLPYLMMGHSMGSFLIRQYITEQDCGFAKGLSGVIIMGTGWTPNPVLELGKAVARAYGINKPGKTARLVEILSFGNYLKRIPDAKTFNDWLTKDEEIVKKFRNHPWCSFRFTPNGFYNMFSGMQKANDVKRMKNLPEGLPLLFTSGAEDPVGNWGEGVRKAFMVYTENTKCKVDIRLYHDDRHEILNEIDRADVYNDLRIYLENCLGNYQETFGVVPEEIAYKE